MSSRICICGLGVVTAIGRDVPGNLHALRNGKAGVGTARILETVHRNDWPVAEVPYSNEELAAMSGGNAAWPRTALLSMLAAREALQDAHLPEGKNTRTGFISANSVGGMERTEYFYPAFKTDPAQGQMKDVLHHECGAVTELVADALQINDFITTVSTACSSSANSLMLGARMIKQNKLDVVLAGGADALSRFTLNGFSTLMILDKAHCTPFDANRKGLNLGEGAGYVVLVKEDLAREWGLQVYGYLSGYANANDAYHQTASSPEGKGNLLAMTAALQMSGLQASDIQYINAHGTGTANNDLSEGTAVMQLFGNNVPMLSSTKAFTGHTLGACGGIEAVYAMLAIAQGIVYPNLNFTERIPELSFDPVTELKEGQDIRNVLSNSFGFGGNCSALVFSKS